jgi:hypothetical protein
MSEADVLWLAVGFTLGLLSMWLWALLDEAVAADEAEVSPERIRRTLDE